MTDSRVDVLVLGSTLGGLVAASYLARARLRVAVVEEEAHTKRSPLLREPFLLSGLEPGGRIQRVLHELAFPLSEQREIERRALALQVLLPDCWVDVARGASPLSKELQVQGLGDSRTIRAWLAELASHAQRARAQLWETPAARHRSTSRRLIRRPGPDVPVAIGNPTIPPGLESFVRCQLDALGGLVPDLPAQASPLLLQATREGGFVGGCSRSPFLSLFRRRLPMLHGEIRPISGFGLDIRRGEVRLELAQGHLSARSLVLAVPREPLREYLDETSRVPSWLPRSLPPLRLPQRLFRADRLSMPSGMADRVIRADGEGLHWLSRTPDADDPRAEWIVATGLGAGDLSPIDPLGTLAPFSVESLVPVDPGPQPRWDLDAAALRFQRPEISAVLRGRPAMVNVGPELAPALGFEGEVLCARRVALKLAERLGSTRILP